MKTNLQFLKNKIGWTTEEKVFLQKVNYIIFFSTAFVVFEIFPRSAKSEFIDTKRLAFVLFIHISEFSVTLITVLSQMSSIYPEIERLALKMLNQGWRIRVPFLR